jgi:hypothetical protein
MCRPSKKKVLCRYNDPQGKKKRHASLRRKKAVVKRTKIGLPLQLLLFAKLHSFVQNPHQNIHVLVSEYSLFYRLSPLLELFRRSLFFIVSLSTLCASLERYWMPFAYSY